MMEKRDLLFVGVHVHMVRKIPSPYHNHSLCLGSLVTKSHHFILLLVNSFKYDKCKPILNSETLM